MHVDITKAVCIDVHLCRRIGRPRFSVNVPCCWEVRGASKFPWGWHTPPYIPTVGLNLRMSLVFINCVIWLPCKAMEYEWEQKTISGGKKHFKSLINHTKESLLNILTVQLGMNEITLKDRGTPWKARVLYSECFVGGIKFLLLLKLELDDHVCCGFELSERNNAPHLTLGKRISFWE